MASYDQRVVFEANTQDPGPVPAAPPPPTPPFASSSVVIANYETVSLYEAMIGPLFVAAPSLIWGWDAYGALTTVAVPQVYFDPAEVPIVVALPVVVWGWDVEGTVSVGTVPQVVFDPADVPVVTAPPLPVWGWEAADVRTVVVAPQIYFDPADVPIVLVAAPPIWGWEAGAAYSTYAPPGVFFDPADLVVFTAPVPPGPVTWGWDAYEPPFVTSSVPPVYVEPLVEPILIMVWVSKGVAVLHEDASVSYVLEVYFRSVVGTVHARLIDDLGTPQGQVSTVLTAFSRVRSSPLSLTVGREYRTQVGKLLGDSGEILGSRLLPT